MYKQRVTDAAVYFVGGPFSQWFPSLFRGKLEPDGEVLEFNCCEQYMMAGKAHLMGDREMLALIMEIVPEGGNTAFFADLNSRHSQTSTAARKRFFEIPKLQKQAGKQVAPFDQKLWDDTCDRIVARGTFYKFSQNGHLKAILLNTDKRLIVEGASYDEIWGVGLDYADPRIEDRANWRGLNKLGNALMGARAVFEEEAGKPITPRYRYDPFTMTFE